MKLDIVDPDDPQKQPSVEELLIQLIAESVKMREVMESLASTERENGYLLESIRDNVR